MSQTIHLKILRTILLSFIIMIVTTFINMSACHTAIRTVTGTVTKISDGDTIRVITLEQTKLKVRLYGIDAAETPRINAHSDQISKAGQRYALESRKALEGKIRGRQVKLDIIDVDKYRRMVCIVWLDDRNINLEMLREGHAEAFVEYLKPPYRAQFLAAEREARGARLGIWSLPDYERPRDFRKRLKISGGR
jgi:micrococcal nuclease